eukprot:TRINITY_DN390_c1_g1_i1.p1 TRINITY_DN390_c1_g1~~TRINITY_DN390_c1_g1_i1.p1  ORF type:complete len:194 (+),score=32.37 TRINITY_DN390_c1_g1_i1:51-632(+)
MEVYVEVPNASEPLLIELREHTTVGEVKDIVERETQIDRNTFSLKIEGEVRMNESLEVNACGIAFGDSMELVVNEWWPLKGPGIQKTMKTKYRIAKHGDGTPIKKGDTIAIDVTGILAEDGKEIWRTTGNTHKVDVGRSIVGFDKGCLGMLPTEVRCLLIPPMEGYPVGYETLKIPRGKDLIFEIRLHCLIED